MSTQATGTAWERGRFDARDGPRKVLFGRMYEDAEIEARAFAGRSRIFCIASAGCTALRLAPEHEVVAVDINPVQLAYAGSRFDGAPPCRGSAERLLGAVRSLAPLAGWSGGRVREFLDMEVPQQQSEYWRRHLDTRRLRIGLETLFSLTALRAVYAAPFLTFLPRRLGAVMRGRIERCVARHPNRANPYARGLLLGEWEELPVPAQATRIRLVHEDAAAFLERAPAASFDGFALSNILDGAGAGYRERLARAVRHAATPEAVMVLRSFGEAAAESTTNLAPQDRSMLWGVVDVRSACSW